MEPEEIDRDPEGYENVWGFDRSSFNAMIAFFVVLVVLITATLCYFFVVSNKYYDEMIASYDEMHESYDAMFASYDRMQGCFYVVMGKYTFSPDGGKGILHIEASKPTCEPSIRSKSDWIKIISDNKPYVEFEVESSGWFGWFAEEREGSIVISGHEVVIRQGMH